MKKATFSLILTFFLFFGSLSAIETKPTTEASLDLLVISCSLNPNSQSALLAKHAVDHLKSQKQNVEFLDLRDYDLPLSNGHDQSAYDYPMVKKIHDRILKAQGILIAAPIYNNNVSAAAKNLIELTTHPHKLTLSGTAWNNKVVGFMGISGSPAGTWAFFPFLNGLMIDAKVIVVPNFVMATSNNFNAQNEIDEPTQKRIEDLSSKMISFVSILEKMK